MVERATQNPVPPIPQVNEQDVAAIQNEANRLLDVQERGELANYEPAFSQTGGLDLRRAAELAAAERDRPVVEAFHVMMPQPNLANPINRLNDLLTGRQAINNQRIFEGRQVIRNHTGEILANSRLQRTAARMQDETMVEDTQSIVHIFGNFS